MYLLILFLGEVCDFAVILCSYKLRNIKTKLQTSLSKAVYRNYCFPWKTASLRSQWPDRL